MGLATFDPDSSTNGALDAGQRAQGMQADDREDKVRAVADLIQNKFLTHTFGAHGEWEVRTTLAASRQAWRYRSSVLVHGKEAGDSFSPIAVDRTRQVRQADAVTEEMIAAFAREAVEVHWARCANVAEYTQLASIYSQSAPRRHHAITVLLILLGVGALFAAYWTWKNTGSVGLAQLHEAPPPRSVRWDSRQIAYQVPAGESFVLPLPPVERMPKDIPIAVTLESSGDEPSWLQLDGERFRLQGTAPLTVTDQLYRLIVRAHADQGGDSRLLILLTIVGQPDHTAPAPKLPGYWTW